MQAKITNQLIARLAPKDKPFEVNDTELRGFILRVQPSGSMSYYAAYRLSDGRKDRFRIGRHGHLTPMQARDRAKEIFADVTKGVNPKAKKKADRAHTLRSFINKEYRPWIEANQQSGAATIKRLESCFKQHLHEKLSQINAWKIEKWRTERLKAGIHPATVNRDIVALKGLLARAHEWRVIAESKPLATVKPKKVDNDRVRYLGMLDPEEESRFRAALDQREQRIRKERISANTWRHERGYKLLPEIKPSEFADHVKLMVLLTLNTGLRRNELFTLAWAKTDLDRAMLTVAWQTAKSSRTRHIPLNEEALAALRKWKVQQDTSGLVFPSRTGEPFSHTKRAWASLLELAKIKDFTWHDMRHHFASQLVMAGVDLNTVRELLGHSDIKMTLRYAHLAPEHKAAAVERLVSSRS